MCHESEPSTAEDPPCRGADAHVKYVEIQTTSRWCGAEVKKGNASSSIDNGSKLLDELIHVKSIKAQSPSDGKWHGREVQKGVCQLRCLPRHLTMFHN
ncbi:hypothetical protein TNCV_4989661 [Trichonephila clavipes]|uniref:Uncharacterized protein n=1 Tax=Trichonephila clavipes TaxID=2585209 RepID=A0A8X6WB97_TRICX|nr:hypothetical protein TNCV_4989661 [Trichonephila clavipes]